MTMTPAFPLLPALPTALPKDAADLIPSWAHPELRYWLPTYIKIRDCILGEQEIKQKGEHYLKRMSEMDYDDYEAFLDRAVFYNMTSRTVDSLTGTVFQRPPKISGLPKRLSDNFDKLCYEQVDIASFLTAIVDALVSLGRYGLLVDRANTPQAVPFLRGYDAENILDWQLDDVDGRRVPVRIVLREFKEMVSTKIGELRRYWVIYRVLSLDVGFDENTGAEKRIYRQYVYKTNDAAIDVSNLDPEVITPTNRGQTFDFIPFQFFGSRFNTADVDRPPCADIVSLNLSHYRTYAELEQARYYTATPIYYVQTLPGNEKAEYVLAPNRVWEVGSAEKPGILEFNGGGLSSQENSLKTKESQIEAIGGRLVGGTGGRDGVASQTDSQTKTNETNERTLLLRTIGNTNTGVTTAVNWWCSWQDEADPEMVVELNDAFLFDNLGARELRAAHEMYQDGTIPVTVLHSYLMKAEVIPDWMSVDEFKTLLNNVDEFPNSPDIWSKQMGYAGAKHRHDVLLARRTLRDKEAQTEIKETLADTNKKDIVGSLDIAQQQVDIAQQQADVTADQIDHQQNMDKVVQKQVAKQSEGQIPGQVQAARQAAAMVPAHPGTGAPVPPAAVQK